MQRRRAKRKRSGLYCRRRAARELLRRLRLLRRRRPPRSRLRLRRRNAAMPTIWRAPRSSACVSMVKPLRGPRDGPRIPERYPRRPGWRMQPWSRMRPCSQICPRFVRCRRRSWSRARRPANPMVRLRRSHGRLMPRRQPEPPDPARRNSALAPARSACRSGRAFRARPRHGGRRGRAVDRQVALPCGAAEIILEV